jgi:hypothetical protein
VRAGKTAIVKGKALSGIAKFDRDNKDALDVWSQLRAKEAAAINKRLQRNALANSLLSSYNRGGWNMYNTFGLWVFDSFTGRWCFLPFGQGWSSPYGYGYGFNIYNCPLPPVVYTPPVNTNPTPTTTTGQMTPEQIQIREERRQTVHQPTFQRFENNNRNETRGGGSRDDDNSGGVNSGGGWNNSRTRDDSNDSRSTTPTYTPSTPTPAPSAPTRTYEPIPPSPKSVKDN